MSTSETNEKAAPKFVRSRPYPAIPLDEAIKRIQTLKDNVGFAENNREAIAKGLGYGSLSGASARTLSALTQYGLLEGRRDRYTLSSLSKQFLLQLTDAEQRQALIEAALTPELFSEVYYEFAGQHLPKQLSNLLAGKKGINHRVSAEVAGTIQSSFEYAGLIDSLTGKLLKEPIISLDSPKDTSDRNNSDGEAADIDGNSSSNDIAAGGARSESESSQAQTNQDSQLVDYNFPLRQDIVVRLRLPREITTKDVTRLTSFLNSLKFDAGETK
jgi:hypothetical protein